MRGTQMRGIFWSSISTASIAILAVPAEVGAQEQMAEQVSAPEIDPDAQALIDEIEAFSEKDQSRDPVGDLLALKELQERVDANGTLQPIDRALLASAFGAAHFYQREFDTALDYYKTAGLLFEEGQAPLDEISGLYNNMAAILGSIGRFDEAETYHRKALAIRQEMEGGRGEKVASSLFGLGYVYFRRGQVEESLDFFRESTVQQLEFVGPENPQSIQRLASLASVLGRSGREDEALLTARKAENLGREFLGEDHPVYAMVLNNLGNALIENGLYVEAISVLRKTLLVRQKTIGETATGTAISLRNLATALKKAGALEEATALNLAAIGIYEQADEIETPYALAYMYADVASIAADWGDWEQYQLYISKALADAEAKLGEDNYDRAQINLYHAERLAEQGDSASALQIAEQWVPVLQAALIESHKDRIWGELLLARLRLSAGQSDYWPLADTAIARLQAKLADLSVTDRTLVREAETHRNAALLYLQMAAEAKDEDRMFTAIQLAGISELSVGQRFASDTLVATEGAQQARLALLDITRRAEQTRERYISSFDTDDKTVLASLVDALALIESEKAEAQRNLASQYPDFVARYRPQPVSRSALQAKLAAQDTLLITFAGPTVNWIVTLTDGSLSIRSLDTRLLSEDIASLRRAVDSPSRLDAFPFDQAHSLFQKLFPEGIANNSRILMHGDGPLASLPLSILLTDKYQGAINSAPWLMRKAAFQVVGNLELFGRTRPAEKLPAFTRMAGIGGASFPAGAEGSNTGQSLFRSGAPSLQSISDLPPLPDAEKELFAISTALGGDEGMILIGPNAAEENFKKTDLQAADIIVFATHGLVAGELRDLWEPALLLGTNSADSGEDGLLGASEIARLRLNADWVILSACNTSAGDGFGGPTYSGLATAFSQAGARSLMLSHWRVRDDAAAFLSVQTISNTKKGMTRAEALRAAQLDLMNDPAFADGAAPAIWAPFVIIEN